MINKNEKIVSIIMPVSIILIFSLSMGIGLYFFFGNLNFFGEQGFHHRPVYFWYGVCLGAFGLSPVIITSLFALLKYKKQTKISLIVMTAIYVCWFVGILAVSGYQNIKIIQRRSASPTEIAERSIQRAKDGVVSPNRERFIDYLGTNIWINEFTPGSYGGHISIYKIKEIIEETARLVIEDNEITPKPVSYGWRIYKGASGKTYVMCMFYDDDSYTVLYWLFPEQKEEWDDNNIPIPAKLEDGFRQRYEMWRITPTLAWGM